MSKAIEENKTSIRVQFIYWVFISTDKNNDKNKTNLPPHPLPRFSQLLKNF